MSKHYNRQIPFVPGAKRASGRAASEREENMFFLSSSVLDPNEMNDEIRTALIFILKQT